jgi:manganese transport protein
MEAFLVNFLKYLGPGLLVTVGFIDPGNWASNIGAGSQFGYDLLWVLSLSTIMLIILQHNVAHLGIVTGLCLSEAALKFTPLLVSRGVLTSAMLASIATSLAEILGGAIALNMLFHIPIKVAALVIVALVLVLTLTNSYRRIEKMIMAFVSLIGLSFLYELSLVTIDWPKALQAAVVPTIPDGSMLLIVSVLGAVIMPHNLFLHSEVIQSRNYNLEDEAVIKKQLDYEFFDTLISMIVGWAINGSIILLAASTFYQNNIVVSELPDAESMLRPLLGSKAALAFGLALLFAGISSSITSGMAGGSIYAGAFGEAYDIKRKASRQGVFISLLIALICIFFIEETFKALIISQAALSFQLPFTIFLQIYLTSSTKVMGKYANPWWVKLLLIVIALVVTFLNVKLLLQLIF